MAANDSTMPTLAELCTAVRRKIDRVNASTPSTTELIEWINESAAELWDEVVTVYEDQYTTYVEFPNPLESVFSIANISDLTGEVYHNQPLRLFKLRSLEYSSNGEWIEIKQVPKQEWWKYSTSSNVGFPAGYTLIGDYIHILPENTAAQTYRMFYVPMYTPMVAQELPPEDCLFTVPNGWHEYVVVDACIKARAKFQEDASLELARKAALLQRIRRAASNRTPGASRKVVERATHRGE